MARFTVDIPDELNRWLMRQATLNRRSKNKQIEHFLTLVRQIPAFTAEKQYPRYELGCTALCQNGKHIFKSSDPAASDFCNCGMYTLGEVKR